MSTAVTTKHIAAHLRSRFAQIQSMGGARLAKSDGSDEIHVNLPSDVHFAVRATKYGVNITIEDRGYVDRVTDGDRAAFDSGQTVIDEVERIRDWFFPDGGLPGQTKWGTILISATATGVRRESL